MGKMDDARKKRLEELWEGVCSGSGGAPGQPAAKVGPSPGWRQLSYA